MSIRRLHRWSDLSEVERVDVYTRQSLSLLLWGVCGYLLLAATPESTSRLQTTAVLVGGFAVTALGWLVMTSVFRTYPAPRPLPWQRLVALISLSGVYVGAVGLTASDTVRGTVAVVVVVNLAASLGGIPDNRLTAALLVTSAALFGLSGGELTGVLAGAVAAATIVFSVRASLWLRAIVTELDAVRHAQSRLAVAEERLRFSRDVHDVLGRRLSTIAVQSELAATLATRGDEGAAARMLEVRAVADEALTEARELARGYRPIDFGNELTGAQSLLRSAGIEVQLDVEIVPRAWHEAAAWVVRESVTNVLRHSTARLVTISYRDGELRVVSDGVRPGHEHVASSHTDGPLGGSGLLGLHERLASVGAALFAGEHGEQWTVTARLPGPGPISAATAAGAGPEAAVP